MGRVDGSCVGCGAASLECGAFAFGGLPLGCRAYGDVLGLVAGNHSGCCVDNDALYAYPRSILNAHITFGNNAL